MVGPRPRLLVCQLGKGCPREEGYSPVKVDPKSTATMISGLVLCSILAYVYVGIKGI